MILPNGDFRATEEDILAGASLGFLLLDLYLADAAWMLDDFRNKGLVSATDFTRNPFEEIDKPSVTPEKVEYANVTAEGWSVRFDHTESAVHAPEDEEDNEEVVGVPETFVILAAWLFD